MKHVNLSTASVGLSAIALFVALGGPAEAASLITGKDIRNNSVTGADIKNRSLTGADIKSGSVVASDVRNGALTGADIKDGTLRAKDVSEELAPTRWLLVNRNGEIEQQSGGFRIANAYPTGTAGEANVYIDSGDSDLTDNGLVASFAPENQASLKGTTPPPGATLNNGRNPGADTNPEFSGEIGVSRCAIGTGPNEVQGVTGVVACAPNDITARGTGASTNTNRYFVVTPRNSDGSPTVVDSSPGANDNTHKRFYVIISGARG